MANSGGCKPSIIHFCTNCGAKPYPCWDKYKQIIYTTQECQPKNVAVWPGKSKSHGAVVNVFSTFTSPST